MSSDRHAQNSSALADEELSGGSIAGGARSHHVQPVSHLRVGQKLAIASCVLMILSMCVFWLVTNQTTENILRQQADSLGNSLARQTAILATELVLANDLISMNVLLSQLTREAAISQAAILSIDDQVIAISGAAVSDPDGAQTSRTDLFGSYVAPIALQDSLAGYVRIHLDQRYIEQGVTRNFLFMLIALLLLALTGISVTLALAQHFVTFPLRMLSASMHSVRRGEPEPCPYGERGDEVGALIRNYNRLIYDLEDPETRQAIFGEEPEPIAIAQTPPAYRKPGSTIVSILHLNISNYRSALHQHDPVETVELINTYYFYIHKVAQLYNGNIEKCAGDEILLTFGAAQSDEDHSFHAVCAALLFLQLADTLSRELEAQSLPSLQFRAGLHCGELLTGVISSLEQKSYTVAGENLALARQICEEGPIGTLLISEAVYVQADADNRLITEEFNEIVDDTTGEFIKTWLVDEPMANYKSLLSRQVEHLLAQEMDV
ncbi:MAG: adenylate/guanylate cyclase domain-containing protein [Gammaproteobacteria bacterium]|nr:adenylate/guanylate cyclase domain-containing protein [Gammaproteobacteria bacterium]